MTRITLIAAQLALLLLCACSKPTAQEIEREAGSGVVLVQCKSFYEIAMPDGQRWWASVNPLGDGEIKLSADLAQIEPTSAYATGFFVSADGKIATCAQVVAGPASPQQVLALLQRNIRRQQARWRGSVDELGHAADSLQQRAAWLEQQAQEQRRRQADQGMLGGWMASLGELFGISRPAPEPAGPTPDQERTALLLKRSRDQLAIATRNLARLDSVNVLESTVTRHDSVSVTLNGMVVTGEYDRMACRVLERDDSHNLALLQLRDKSTPARRHIFDVAAADPLQDWKPGLGRWQRDGNVMVMAFDYNIASLPRGAVRAVAHRGHLTSNSANAVAYDLPGLTAACSGAPVIDSDGQVVAVNSTSPQGGKSHGVRLHRLRMMLDQ